MKDVRRLLQQHPISRSGKVRCSRFTAKVDYSLLTSGVVWLLLREGVTLELFEPLSSFVF